MNRRILSIITMPVMITVFSCGHNGTTKDLNVAENRILQQNDGSVSLILDKASCYNDITNPSNNTADWNVVISKPGRFKVWLSSATKDTSKLNYERSVRINFVDNQLEASPACDKIIRNSSEVHSPYFRADSYIGSVYVQEPGEYNIQLISEKVVKKESATTSQRDDTILMSVNLTPISH